MITKAQRTDPAPGRYTVNVEVLPEDTLIDCDGDVIAYVCRPDGERTEQYAYLSAAALVPVEDAERAGAPDPDPAQGLVLEPDADRRFAIVGHMLMQGQSASSAIALAEFIIHGLVPAELAQ